MKNTKMIMSLLLVVVMLAGCTTYSLYIPPDTRDGLTFFPLEKADRGKKVYFGSWSASLNRGFGFGVDMSHVVAVSGKARQFSFIQYQDGTKAADVEGTYEYTQARGSLFDGFLRVEATFSNKLSGTAELYGESLEGKQCLFELSLKQERRDGEKIGTVSCDGEEYTVTAKTALISESGKLRYRDNPQGFTVSHGTELLAVVSLYGREPFAAFRQGISREKQTAAALTASLLFYRSLLEF